MSHDPLKIAEYLQCDPAVIEEALARQRTLAKQGIRKRIGEILLEMDVISREDLIGALHDQRLGRLRSIAVLFGLTPEDLQGIAPLVSECSISAGEEFIRQDATGACLYLIVKGEALVFWRDDLDERIPLARLGPGESIGEMGYFSNGRHSASVRALTDLELLRIYYDDLTRALERAPRLAKNLLEIVTRRLRLSNFRLHESVQDTRAAEKSLQSLQHLVDMSDIWTLRLTIEGLIERVVYTASGVLNAERASLFLIDPFGGTLWSKVAQGEGSREIRIPVGQGIAGWVAQHEQLVNIADAYKDARFNPEVDQRTGYRTRSVLCGPVKNLQGEIIGVVEIINKKEGEFDGEDERLFQAFAYQTAIALENFQLYQRMVVSHERMAVLLDVATSVSLTLDLDALIDEIVSKITEILHVERSSLFLVDRERDELWSKIAQGTGGKILRFPLRTGLAGHVAETGELLNIKDAYEDRRFNPEFDQRTGFKTRSVLAAPVFNRQGKIIGVTQAMNKKAGVFDRDDEDLLKILTSQIALALENAQLYHRAEEMRTYLENLRQSISNGIITVNNKYEVVTANRAATQLFGLSEERMAGRDARRLLGSRNSGMAEDMQRVYEKHHTVVHYDVALELNETRASVNVNFLPLIARDQKQSGLVLIFEDVTGEKRVRSTLARYMSKDLVDRVLSDPEKQHLGGMRSRATILFSDIRGFTEMANTLKAEETVDFLNYYFTRMVDVIFAERGILDKYIGDALMAVFGVPYVQKDDELRAVRAAVAMKNELRKINRQRRKEGFKPLLVGMGISSGEVVSGNIGSEKRMDFTAVGDGVNVASRLETLTKSYGSTILISDSTYEKVRDHFTIRSIDRVLIRGRNQALEIYEVLGDRNYRPAAADEYFCKGMAAYRKFDFATAARWFGEGAKKDRLCGVFLNRCRDFMQQPPAPDWDGVWLWEERKLIRP